MQRLLEIPLLQWQNQINRTPLLLRGARQVGKSYLIQAFGRQHFTNYIEINFEKRPEFKQAVTSLIPTEICNRLALMTRQTITPGNTLLFLDEIQECPAAIEALRFFKEDMPELHVIGAGSLLEFTLNDKNFRMPVGRVQFYYLKPLSFKEFLLATNNIGLVEYLGTVSPTTGIETVLHNQLLKLLREYLCLGGMPAVIDHYLQTQDFIQCQEVQANLLTAFRSDFGKYAHQNQHKYLQALFERTPGIVGKHFKYSDVDPHMQSRDLKQALSALRDAGLLYQVYATLANGLPFNATQNEKKFKLLFLDVGLVQYSSHLSAELLMAPDLFTVNRGHIMEQFVGQELLTLSKFYQAENLYYWERNKPGSLAEVDYVVHVGANIFPLEVKAGATGRLKSLRLFMQEKNSLLGIRISQHELALQDHILSIPLYMIHELPRLVITAQGD